MVNKPEQIHIPDRPSKSRSDQETITILQPKIINEAGRILAQKPDIRKLQDDIRNFSDLDEKNKRVILVKILVYLKSQFPQITLSQIEVSMREIATAFFKSLGDTTQLLDPEER